MNFIDLISNSIATKIRVCGQVVSSDSKRMRELRVTRVYQKYQDQDYKVYLLRDLYYLQREFNHGGYYVIMCFIHTNKE